MQESSSRAAIMTREVLPPPPPPELVKSWDASVTVVAALVELLDRTRSVPLLSTTAICANDPLEVVGPVTMSKVKDPPLGNCGRRQERVLPVSMQVPRASAVGVVVPPESLMM